MFPEIKNVPCSSKQEAFDLLDKIKLYLTEHSFMTVSAYYRLLEKSPIPENADHFCYIGMEDFVFEKRNGVYYVGSKNPIEIVSTENIDKE